MRCDPVITGRVLQLVNSPAYGLRSPVHDVRHALGLLGTQPLLALVLATKVFTDFEAEAAGLSVGRMWSHGMAVGTWSKRLAQMAGVDRSGANDAFMAGMLHDCGRLLLCSTAPRQHAALVKAVAAGEGELIETETEMLGASHGEAGAVLLQSWGMPLHLVETVAYHHRPSEAPHPPPVQLAFVHVAEHFQSLVGGDPVETDVPLDRSYLEEVGITEEDLEEWKLACDVA